MTENTQDINIEEQEAQAVMDSMEKLAETNLSAAISLVTSMFVSLATHYIAGLGGNTDNDIIIQGDANHRNITIHAIKVAKPGFVVYIRDPEDTELWMRSSEISDVYDTPEEACAVLDAFCNQAAENGFDYPRDGFKVVEQFAPIAEAEEQAG